MAWFALKTKISERILASLMSEAIGHSRNEWLIDWMNESINQWMNEWHCSRTRWWHVCVFCGCLPLFIVWGGKLLDCAYKVSPILFLKMLNLLTMSSFLTEVSSVAFDDCNRSVIFANSIFQHGPQNQHIPKPWVHPPKTDVASLILFPELVRG